MALQTNLVAGFISYNVVGRSATTATTTAWTGSVDGDWQNDGNWTNGSPVDDDVVVFNAGSVDVDTNLSNGSIAPAALYVHHGYTGSIAPDGQLVLDSIGKVVISKRLGTVSLKANMPRVYILRTAGGTQPVRLDAETLGDAITDLYILDSSGKVVIDASATCTNAYLTPKLGAQAHLSLGANVTATNLKAYRRGYVTTASGATNIQANGGTVLMTGAASATDVKVGRDGAVHDQATGGIATLLTVYPDGLYTVDQTETSAATIGKVEMYGDAAVDLRTGRNLITVTNNVVQHDGGKLLLDDGAVGTIS